MSKYILGIYGMRCGMCEAHVKDSVTKNIEVKKISSSHFKNELIVITDLELEEEDFHKMIDPTGYEITSFKKDVAVKGLFGWR